MLSGHCAILVVPEAAKDEGKRNCYMCSLHGFYPHTLESPKPSLTLNSFTKKSFGFYAQKNRYG